MNEQKNKSFFEYLLEKKSLGLLYPGIGVIVMTLLFVVFSVNSNNVVAEESGSKNNFDYRLPSATDKGIGSNREEAARLAQHEDTSSVATDFDVAELEKAAKNIHEKESSLYEAPKPQQIEFESSSQIEKKYRNSSMPYERKSVVVREESTAKITTTSAQIASTSSSERKRNPFYDNNNSNSGGGNKEEASNNAIECVVHGRQKVETYNTLVKLRVVKSTNLNGRNVPVDTYVFALVTGVSGGRILMTVSSIEIDNMVIPCRLTVYNKGDNLEGVIVYGGDVKEATAKAVDEETDRNTQTEQTTFGSIVNATKSVFRSRRDRVNATLLSGHRVVLK